MLHQKVNNMNKFEQLYKNIKNKISIIVEDFNVSSDSSFNEDKFDFKKDENNNIICSFAMSLNGKKLITLAKIFNEKITFVITNEEGQSFNYDEKEFATNYYKDYDDFKKAQGQTRDVIIALQFIPKSIFVVVIILFHGVILLDILSEVNQNMGDRFLQLQEGHLAEIC